MANAGVSKGMSLPFPAFTLRISIFVFILISSAMLTFGRAEAYVLEQARDAITDAARPFLEIFSGPITSTRKFFRNVGQIWDLYAENERLRAENARLLEWKAAALQLERTVKRYNALLNVSLNERTEYVTGRVIGDSAGPFVRTFLVNAGQDQGVAKGQAVISGEGLVGRVIGAGGKAARVMLLNDLNSRVPVVVEPGMYPAMLSGDNSALPKLEYLDIESDIRPGDRVVTSGDGGALPRGLPIGIVVADREEQTYRVRLNSPLARVDFVRVVRFEVDTVVDGEDGAFPSPLRRRAPRPSGGEAGSSPESPGEAPATEGLPAGAANDATGAIAAAPPEGALTPEADLPREIVPQVELSISGPRPNPATQPVAAAAPAEAERASAPSEPGGTTDATEPAPERAADASGTADETGADE